MSRSIHDTNFLPALEKGEPAAFEVLYHQYLRPIRFYIGQIVKNDQAADDITIETFTKMLDKRWRFNDLKKLEGFLFTAAANASKDYLRRQKKQNTALAEAAYLSEVEEESLEVAYIRTEAARVLKEAVDSVPGQSGEVIRLLFLQGKTLQEIAGQLQISYNTVQNHRAKGLQHIRRTLKQNKMLSVSVLLFALQFLEGQ